ncbi:LamG-like jellyroll fold domain-containing protein, partial [Aliikangiella sp. G2MR2-5]|uniref:LamG-like jellyroll fold domain-containing protein n=1 Tax=Aliikangiella sp. G2MR2-5 TaxID=2788943 RepID=UPI0018AC2121
IEAYQYDELQRLKSVTNSGKFFEYNLTGDRTSRTFEEQVETLLYDDKGMLGSINKEGVESGNDQALSLKTPILNWQLDETSGTTAIDQQGTINALYRGNITLGEEPTVEGDSSIYLNGSQYTYVTAGNSDTVKLTTGTIEAWIKTTDAGSGMRAIVSKQGAYGVFLYKNRLIFHDFIRGGGRRESGYFPNDGKWHHIAFAFESGKTNGSKLYLDGQLVLTSKMTVSTQGYSLIIGAMGNSGNMYNFKGNIDNVKIYNEALKPHQISSLFQRNIQKFNWQLDDDGISSSVKDSSNLLDGIYNGAVSFLQNGSPGSNASVYLDGSSGTYLDMGNSASIQLNQGTIDFWTKTSDAGSSIRSLVSKPYAFGVYVVDNELSLYDWYTSEIIGTGRFINDNNWHNVVMSFEKHGTVELYLDGEFLLSRTHRFVNHDSPLLFGAGLGGTTQNFSGYIDNIKLYNTSLSLQEVAEFEDGANSKTEILLTYDPNGNTIQKGEFTFSYNDANRMATSSVGGLVTNYQYNAKGERSVKTRSGVETHYIFDLNGQLIAEADGNGNIQKEYVYFNGQPFAQVIGDDVYFYHNSHLGTPEMMTDANQNVVWQASYTPFGLATVTNETVVNNIRFPGQYYDAESGLHYNYFRDYDPEIGRYIQSDPIGLNGGINTYGYVLQNPISNRDPNGLEVEVLVGGANWYDHVALRINNRVYSNGRYRVPGRDPYFFEMAGPNVLTVKSANSYYETSDSCGTCETKGYKLDVTPQEEAKMIQYYQGLINSSQPHPTRKNWYVLPSDYKFIGNNCASTVQGALSAGLPWYHEMSLPGVATPQTLELNLQMSPFLVDEVIPYQEGKSKP